MGCGASKSLKTGYVNVDERSLLDYNPRAVTISDGRPSGNGTQQEPASADLLGLQRELLLLGAEQAQLAARSANLLAQAHKVLLASPVQIPPSSIPQFPDSNANLSLQLLQPALASLLPQLLLQQLQNSSIPLIANQFQQRAESSVAQDFRPTIQNSRADAQNTPQIPSTKQTSRQANARDSTKTDNDPPSPRLSSKAAFPENGLNRTNGPASQKGANAAADNVAKAALNRAQGLGNTSKKKEGEEISKLAPALLQNSKKQAVNKRKPAAKSQRAKADFVRVKKKDYLQDPAGIRQKYGRHFIIEPDEPVRLGITRKTEGGWHTIYVFVSSTFKDMHGERDHLTRTVFPEINERCRSRKVRVIPVDLRWGLTKEETAEGGKGALELCLDEIDRCHKWIIVLSGERYGWVPDSYKVSDDPKWDWLRNFQPGFSITALEIQYGILRDPDSPVHAFVYIRDPMFMNECNPIDREIFMDQNRAKQSALMDKCRQHKYCQVVENYTCSFDRVIKQKEPNSNREQVVGGYTTDLQGWGDQVVSDIWEAVCIEFPTIPEAADSLVQERVYHDMYVEHHTGRGTFVGREALMKEMLTFVLSPVRPPEKSFLAVRGVSGCGKSALLANLCDCIRMIQEKRDGYEAKIAVYLGALKLTNAARTDFLLAHYIGASPSSTNIRRTLGRFCSEIKHRYGLKEDGALLKHNYEDLKKTVWDLLTKAAELATGNIVIIIDGVSQLDNTDRCHSMDWLWKPGFTFPEKIRVLVSTLESNAEGETHPCLLSMRQFQTPPHELEVGALESKMQKELIQRVLKEYHKNLDTEQTKLLLRKQGALTPLYLVVSCEEVRVFGLYEGVTDHIRKMPDTIPEMFSKVLERIETDLGQALVTDALCLLACSRNGLLEVELLDLLAPAGEFQLARAYWAKLYRSLELYLRPGGVSGEGTLDFYFSQLAEAVRDRYLSDPSKERHYHQVLANYFRQRANLQGRAFNIDAKFRVSLLVLKARIKFKRLLKKRRTTHFATQEEEEELQLAIINLRALELMPFHQIKGWQWVWVENTLTNIRYVELMCANNLTYELIATYMQFDTYHRAASGAPVEGQLSIRSRLSPDVPDYAPEEEDVQSFDPLPEPHSFKRIYHFMRFVYRNSHILSKEPSLAFQLAFNEPDRTAPARNAKARLRVDLIRKPWLQHINKPQEIDQCLMTLPGHTNFVWALAISPATAGDSSCYIVSACWDGKLKIWDADTGLDLNTLIGHTANVRACAFSPCGKYIASGGGDWSLKVWDLRTGFELQTKDRAHNDVIWSVCWSPDGKYVITGSEDRKCSVWSFPGLEKFKDLEGHQEWVRAVAVSQKTNLLVSASDDETVKVWDMKTWKLVVTLTGHTSVVRGVAFSPEDDILLSCSADRTIKAWHTKQWSLLKTFRGHKGIVHSVSWSLDGLFFCSSSLDKTIKVWEYASKSCISTLRGHTGNVRSCAHLHRGSRVVSASDDCRLKIWDYESIRELREVQDERLQEMAENDLVESHDINACRQTIVAHSSYVWSIAISPDSKRVLSTSWDATAKVWDIRTGHEVPTDMRHNKNIRCCAWAPKTTRFPGGQFVATGSGDQTVKIWETKTFRQVAHLKGHTDVVWSVAFSPNVAKIATASEDRTIKVWDSLSWREIACLRGHLDWVRCVSFSPEGETIITGADDETIRKWDADLVEEQMVITGHTGVLRCATFSPDGGIIVSASGDKTLKLWKSDSGAQYVTLHGHRKIVNWCEYSPDGHYIVSASGDSEIRIWDSYTGRCVQVLKGHSRDVHAARFTPDGSRIISCSDDCSIKVWDFLEILEVESAQGGPVIAQDLQPPDLDTESSDVMDLVLTHPTILGVPGLSGAPLSPGGRHLSVNISFTTHAPSFNSSPYAKSQMSISVQNRGHLSFVWDVKASPNGQLLCSAGWEGTLIIWTVTPPQKLRELVGHSANVRACAFSPDSKRVVSAGGDWTMKVWDVESGKLLHDIHNAHTDVIWDLAWSPNGRWICTASEDRTLKIWNAETAECLHDLLGHTDWVRCASFSSNSRLLASASDDESVKIWDCQSSFNLLTTLTGHSGVVRGVSFSHDCKYVLSSSSDRTIRAYNTTTWSTIKVFRGHRGIVHSCSFSEDDKFVVSSSLDCNVRIWDFATKSTVAILEGHGGNVRSCAFVPRTSPAAPRLAVSCSDDQTVCVWDCTDSCSTFLSKQQVQGRNLGDGGIQGPASNVDDDRDLCLHTLVGHTTFVWSTCVSPDGKKIVTTCWDATIKVWECVKNSQGGYQYLPLETPDMRHQKNVRCCAYAPSTAKNPQGEFVATGSGDCTIKIWDTSTWKEAAHLKGHSDVVWGVAFSFDAKKLASGSEDRTVRIWSCASWQTLRELKGHLDWVRCVTFSPDGDNVVSGSDDETIKVWDAESGSEVATLTGHVGAIRRASCCPDSRILVSGSADKTVRMWDLASGRCVAVMHGHRRIVNWVEFSPNGKFIISAGGDGEIGIWNPFSSTPELLEMLHGHTKDAHCVKFFRDGTRFVSVSDDRSVKIWDFTAASSKHHGVVHDPTDLANTSRSMSRASTANSMDYQSMSSHTGTDNASHLSIDTNGSTDPSNGGRPRKKKKDRHRDSVTCVKYVTAGAAGDLVLSASKDRTVKVWSPEGKYVHSIKCHAGTVRWLDISPQGDKLLTCSWDRTLKVSQMGGDWNTLSTMTGHKGILHSCAFSTDGQHVTSCSEDLTLKIWSVNGGPELHTLRGHNLNVKSVAYSPSGRWLVSGGGDGVVKVWDAKTFSEIKSFTAHMAPLPSDGRATNAAVSSLGFSPDGKLLLTSCEAGVKVWSTDTWQMQGVISSPDVDISGASFALGGMYITIVNDAKTLLFYSTAMLDVPISNPIGKFWTQGTGTCVDACGDLVVTGDTEGRIYIVRAMRFPIGLE